jgi:mono/diheme cytochrome c family protein
MARLLVRLRLFALCALLMSGASPIHAQRLGQGQGMKGDDTAGSMRRHQIATISGIPAQYRLLQNSWPQTARTMQHGADIFAQNCAACHGTMGLGNGSAGLRLRPPPANLLWSKRMPMTRWDPYLFWTIAEGGKPVGSAMPAFKSSLSTGDIWSVIAFIQSRLGNQIQSPLGRSRRG